MGGFDSISVSLQSIQETLEKELEKFEEIGKASLSPSDSYNTGLASPSGTFFNGLVINEDTVSNQSHIYAKEQSIQCQALLLLELGDVEILKSKLEDVSATIKSTDYQITQLESILDGRGVLHEASTSTSEPVKEKYREMEIELEGLFQQKIEYEIKHLMVMNMTQSLSVVEVDKVALYEEQKHLAAEQMQTLHKLKDAEHRAVALKNQAEELEGCCSQLLATEEVLKIQNSVYKHILYFTVEIIMLFIMFVIFLLRPGMAGVVPT